MAGLLDFLSTPGGVGLLSAVAGGMAGARRGTPINNIGRGLVTGVAGYQSAQEQAIRDKENALTKQYRELQMQQLQRQMEQQKSQHAWKAGLPSVMKPSISEQGTQLNEQDAAFGDEGTQATIEAGQYAPNAQLRVTPQVDQQAVQDYLMQPDSPFADELIKQQIVPEKPQLVTVYGEDGKPMQKWLRPGESTGVDVGMGKPEGESYKERTVSPDGRTYVKQYSQDGGKTWQQIEGTRPYDIRSASGSSNINQTLNNYGEPKPYWNANEGRYEFYQFNKAGEPRVAPLPKGVQPDAEGKLGEAQTKQIIGVNNLQNAIREYRSELSAWTPGMVVSPDSRAKMGTKYNNMMLQAKEAFNLGVLNGPDYDILQQVVTNPTTMKGAITSRGALDTQASELSRIMGEVGATTAVKPRPAKDDAHEKRVDAKPAATFDLPPNAKQFEGKTLRDTKSGKRFKSVNGKWVPQ